jgi:hypothetical protein
LKQCVLEHSFPSPWENYEGDQFKNK